MTLAFPRDLYFGTRSSLTCRGLAAYYHIYGLPTGIFSGTRTYWLASESKYGGNALAVENTETENQDSVSCQLSSKFNQKEAIQVLVCSLYTMFQNSRPAVRLFIKNKDLEK